MKVNGMTKLGSAATLALLLLTAGSAQAQLLFGSRLGQAHYEGDDTKIIMKVGADMLRNASDGESRPGPIRRPGTAGPSRFCGATRAVRCRAATPRSTVS